MANEKVEAILEVQKAVEAAMAEVIAYLQTNKNPTAKDAHVIIDRVLLRFNCESPEGHIVAGGKETVEPHAKGSGVLNMGEPIVIDIYPRSKKTGYFADMTRTVCLGQPPEQLKRMYEAVLGAQALAISMVKPGTPCIDIQNTVEKFFTEAGYRTSGKGKEFTYAEGFVHGVGHGVGLKVHEAPRIGRGSKDILNIGDVVTIEPGLYYKNIGGVRIEDMLLVTKDGCQNLTNFTKDFILEVAR